jgi:hypothetical protein
MAQIKVRLRPDPISATLKIEAEIPEVFCATHYFALQQFERVFLGYNVPMSDRLRALADFVERTQEA